MAAKAFLTEEEHAGIATHLESDAAKAVGLEYAKNSDGKYVLVVEGREGFSMENVTGLKSAVESSRAQLTEATDKLRLYGELDPTTVPDMKRKAAQFDELDPKAEAGKAKAKFDEWKGEFVESVKVQHAEAMAVVSADRDACGRSLSRS